MKTEGYLKKILDKVEIQLRKHKKLIVSVFAALCLLYIFCLPKELFKEDVSSILNDSSGKLLGARIAKDGQWRFPYSDDIPEKFKTCIIEFEDRRFEKHWGVDPWGIARAIEQNIRNGEVVSGGSTLTMQTIRMSRGLRKRNVLNKIIEAIMATRMEWSYSKHEILSLYSSNAPFGGNVVGLEAASWRYYAKPSSLLSWGEAATLAVLPNSPSLIHPGRNRMALRNKRDRLLDRLLEQGKLDSISWELAKEEPLPEKPYALPQVAPHLHDYLLSSKQNTPTYNTTIDRNYHTQTQQALTRNQARLAANGIHNACAIIIEVETGNVVSYVGNMPDLSKEHAPSVDIIKANRSTGSILKPILYASMLNEGQITPRALMPDIPTQMGSYRPLNYYETYDGAIGADKAVVRSLNVPTIRMLQKFGLQKFKNKLEKMGMTSLTKPASHYGLTLVVGGSEGKLLEITNMYAGMARTVNHFGGNSGKYSSDDFREPNFLHLSKEEKKTKLLEQAPILNASSIWQTFNAIQQVERPTEEGNWEQFNSSKRIAWKTGTSYGFRDAWAVGVTPKYAVGVWVGNADGEGRPNLVGVKAAAPILFDIFNFLPHSEWFEQPYDEMEQAGICKSSGFLASSNCEEIVRQTIPSSCMNASTCPYHILIQVNQDEQRVNVQCEDMDNIRQKSWFVLPPLQELYYKRKNPSYSKLPPFKEGCSNQSDSHKKMELIYPKRNAKIYIPIERSGEKGKTIFRATHREGDAILYWHLNDVFIGETETFHEVAVNPEIGKHTLYIVDGSGNRIQEDFEILGK